MKLSVVIPVYNERATLEKLVKRVLEQTLDLELEVILIDDGSTDGTRELVEQLEGGPVKVLLHEVNRGKGAALRNGFESASGDVVVVQDADLEYDPAEYPKLLGPILDGRADVVYGSRFLGGPHRVLLYWHYLGNRLLTMFSNMLTNLNLTDMETCFKMFRADVIKNIRLESDRFGFEPEITAKVARGQFRLYEVPISYSGRDYSEGKKITWRDGVAALWHILRFNLLE